MSRADGGPVRRRLATVPSALLATVPSALLAALLATVLATVLTGCGVTAQDEPEVLRSPPAPTATPSTTERPTGTPTPTR